jgi:hypothetical protein
MINRTDNHYNFMQYNLGWATATTMNYSGGTSGNQSREIQVRITQTGVANPASETFAVTQAPQAVTVNVSGTYYQWGRKDPMPPATGNGDAAVGERQLWYGAAAYTYGGISGQTTLGGAIMNPTKLISGSPTTNWCSTVYNNLWDATNAVQGATTLTDTEIVKTVYDPNPVGFKMPPSNAWTRFSLTGSNVSKIAEINITSASQRNFPTDRGYHFYTQDDGEGLNVLYQAIGYRNNGLRTIQANDSRGTYSSALPASDETGYYMLIGPDLLYPASGGGRKAHGFSVRPITD